MLIRKIAAISALVVASMMPAMASAATSEATATSEAARCALHDHQVVSVTPYSVEQHVGYSTLSRLGGADVHVRAEPGLTAQWLQVSLARHIAGVGMGELRRQLEYKTSWAGGRVVVADRWYPAHPRPVRPVAW